MPEPARPAGLSSDAHWLAGEGAGSWFHIAAFGDLYTVTRYSPEGRQECSGLFKVSTTSRPNLTDSFRFVHLSHCAEVCIDQQGQTIVLTRMSDVIEG